MQFFEFGKTYHTSGIGDYEEVEHLSLYFTGLSKQVTWKSKATPTDFYVAKGITEALLKLCGIDNINFTQSVSEGCSIANFISINDQKIVLVGEVSPEKLKSFDIKQPVFFIDLKWLSLLELNNKKIITYKEVSKFPSVNRDLALVVNRNITFDALQDVITKAKISKLKKMQLFDIFESDKLGVDKKSMAVNFTFIDEEKTLTDKEIDTMMTKLISTFEKELNAEIRK